MAYRWTVSAGLFLGGLSTLLAGEMCLGTPLLDPRLSFGVWLLASGLGIGASLTSLFLHSEGLDPESPLNRYEAALAAVALNSWPWVLGVTLLWSWRAGPT